MPFEPEYIRKHDQNYLEIMAEKAANKAYKEYLTGQNALKKEFPYFPNTKDMF